MRQIKNFGKTTAGLILLAVGAVFTPLPPPFFGIPLLIIGTALVVAGSKTARRIIQNLRHKYPKIFGYLHDIEHKLPEKAKYYIQRTNPKPLTRKARATAAKAAKAAPKNPPMGVSDP